MILIGCVTDDNGRFSLVVDSSSGELEISIDFIGYMKKMIRFIPSGRNISLGDMVLEEDADVLSEAVVTGKVEAQKASLERTSINASSNMASSKGSAIDVLNSASSVTVVPLLEATEVELNASGASFIVANVQAKSLEVDLSGASSAKISATIDEMEVSASGASKAEIERATCRDCDIEATGASKITGSLSVNKCNIEASGASKINLTGSAHQAEFEISGASKLNASGFVTAHCSVEASGASAAYVHCTNTLSAEALGSSKVGYSGDCRLNIASQAIFKQN
jgi:hypothetical protein